MNAPVPDPALTTMPPNIRANPTPVGVVGDQPIYATGPEATAAVERAAEAIVREEGVIDWGVLSERLREHPRGQARAALAAALDVKEMAVALFAHEYPGRFWGDAPGWMQALYVERAITLRAAILGAGS